MVRHSVSDPETFDNIVNSRAKVCTMESLEVRDSRFCYWIISFREFPSPDNARALDIPSTPRIFALRANATLRFSPFFTGQIFGDKFRSAKPLEKVGYEFIALQRGDNFLRGSMFAGMNFSSRSEISARSFSFFFFLRREILLEK